VTNRVSGTILKRSNAGTVLLTKPDVGPRFETMSTNASNLGRCPLCDEPIPRVNKLIEYRTERGWTAVFAECSDCHDVVHPQ